MGTTKRERLPAAPLPPVSGPTRFRLNHLSLPLQRTADSINRTGELEEETVSHGLEKASPVPLGSRVDDQAPLLGQPRKGALLGLINEATEACNIGAKHCRKATVH
jgi:hypothetical protein